MAQPPGEVSQLLVAWNKGDGAALNRRMLRAYEDLGRVDGRHMGGQKRGGILQTTALINEAYVRLVGQHAKKWQNRSHFFAVGAQAMRHILVDYARSRQSAKRGGGVRPVSLDQAMFATDERAAELVAVAEALTELARLHPRQSRAGGDRFFGGLTVEETAEVLQVSPETVMRDWRMAKAWLHRALGQGGQDDT